jgi:hypothetical protein
MTAVDRVCEILIARDIRHALIGAAALAARGVSRSTFDIDLLVADPRVLEREMWQPLASSGFAIDARTGDADDPLGGVVRIEYPGERPVDVILGKPSWQHRAVERADVRAGGPPIVQARDLVLLKLYAGGSQDLWDIRELLAQHRDTLLREVSDDIQSLPEHMQSAWRAVAAEQG